MSLEDGPSYGYVSTWVYLNTTGVGAFGGAEQQGAVNFQGLTSGRGWAPSEGRRANCGQQRCTATHAHV